MRARKRAWFGFHWRFTVLGVILGLSFLYGVSLVLGSTVFSLATPFPLALWPEPRLSVDGFRVHHWMIGLVFVGLGCIVRGKIGSILLGVGVFFIADDAYDLMFWISSIAPKV